MTKDEVAELLEVSTRQVERFTSAGRLSVTYERGTTRKVPVYVRSDVERLKGEIENTTHARPAIVPAESQQTGIATISDRGASQLSELVAILRDAAESSRRREDFTFWLINARDVQNYRTFYNFRLRSPARGGVMGFRSTVERNPA